MHLGLYLAVPFCRSKCSFCNFASQAARPGLDYAQLLAREIALAAATDGLAGATLDSIYWGGGTPTLLPPGDVAVVAGAIRDHFTCAPDCEHTLEAAPGTLTPDILAAFAAAGVNRVSLGVQSFQDEETRAVGRLHRRATVTADLECLRAAGLDNLNLDLIAGLPHQTPESWRDTLERALDSGAPHLSVYMLEVDEDSRLGNELLAGGARYHAHFVPDEDAVADAYETACDRLQAAGVAQYEISNFARSGRASRHNLRYWRRGAYLGAGVDAHSLLPAPPRRCANPESIADYAAALRAGRLPRAAPREVSAVEALEETWFLGLRCNAGLDVAALAVTATAVPGWLAWLRPRWEALVARGLLQDSGSRLALTWRGRLLSNQVFAAALGYATAPPPRAP